MITGNTHLAGLPGKFPVGTVEQHGNQKNHAGGVKSRAMSACEKNSGAESGEQAQRGQLIWRHPQRRYPSHAGANKMMNQGIVAHTVLKADAIRETPLRAATAKNEGWTFHAVDLRQYDIRNRAAKIL
jgi:hypothetical protein